MSSPVRAASVVVNWNGRERLATCLASLEAQVVPEGWQHEVVLVDNASSDDSVALVERSFPGVTVVRRASNGGYGAGANAALAVVDADFVVVVNNDAWFEPDLVHQLVTPMLADDTIGATTATVLLEGVFVRDPEGDFTAHDGVRWSRDTTGRDDAVPLINSTGNLVSVSGNGRDRGWLSPVGTPFPEEVFGFHGGACALRRRALDEVGDFDERLFMYYEDTDLSWRLRRHGWRVTWAERAVSHHAHAASSGTGSRLFVRWNTRNRVVVALRNAPLRTLPSVVVRAAASTARAALEVARAPSDRARRDAAAGRLVGLAEAAAAGPAALRHRWTSRHAAVPPSALAPFLVDDGSST